MKVFILLCISIAIVAAEGTVDSYEVEEVKGNMDGVLCALGIIMSPISGTVYAVARCLWKTNADDVWSCIKEDMYVTLTAMLGASIGVCLLDPFWR